MAQNHKNIPKKGVSRECDVCIINSGDHSVKDDVKWCGMCKKWRCAECRKSPDKIAEAVVRNAVDVVSKKATKALVTIRTVLKNSKNE